MLYLSGNTSLEYLRELGCGVLLTPGKGGRRKLRGILWAADTGIFARGADFDLGRYLRWLDWMAPAQQTCLFATAPDVLRRDGEAVIGDAAATLERSLPVFGELRQRGYLPALVAQDGLERLRVPWDTFGALFIGGSTEWKLSGGAAWLCQEARARGKVVHMGRVNSYARLSWAQSLGCHSCDGTFLAKAPMLNGPRYRRWMERVRRQPALPLVWERAEEVA